MGKFIDEKTIINNAVESYNNYINDKGIYLDQSPTFVTYFSKDVQKSTNDVGLSAVTEIVGANSPVKYRMINDFPIYGVPEMVLQYDYQEDIGLDTPIDGTGIIVPNTVKPLVDDLFIISYLDKKKLFRISNIEGSNIGSQFFYQISYTLSNYDPEMLLERQISGKYDVDYKSIGTRTKSVIEHTEKMLLNDLENTMDELRKFYKRNFYDENLNVFLYNGYLYDNYLHHFINRYNLFLEKRTLNTNIVVEPVMEVDSIYDTTIYHSLELDKPTKYANKVIEMTIPKTNRKLLFSRSWKEYKSLVWGFDDQHIDLKQVPDDFYNIQKAYFKKYDFLADRVKVLLEMIQEYKVGNDLRTYINIPCMLYILSRLRKLIIKL